MHELKTLKNSNFSTWLTLETFLCIEVANLKYSTQSLESIIAAWYDEVKTTVHWQWQRSCSVMESVYIDPLYQGKGFKTRNPNCYLTHWLVILAIM